VRRQSAAGDASVVFKIWLYFVQVGLLIVQARSGGGRCVGVQAPQTEVEGRGAQSSLPPLNLIGSEAPVDNRLCIVASGAATAMVQLLLPFAMLLQLGGPRLARARRARALSA
jgi:hypothetical protein